MTPVRADLAGRVAQAIEAARVPLDQETNAQNAIAAALSAIANVRAEVVLTAASRIDFVCDFDGFRIGVEVKINKGRGRQIFRQMERYAQQGDFAGLVLASNRPISMPAIIAGVPVVVASLGRAWL